jgi:hypothetical protein
MSDADLAGTYDITISACLTDQISFCQDMVSFTFIVNSCEYSSMIEYSGFLSSYSVTTSLNYAGTAPRIDITNWLDEESLNLGNGTDFCGTRMYTFYNSDDYPPDWEGDGVLDSSVVYLN